MGFQRIRVFVVAVTSLISAQTLSAQTPVEFFQNTIDPIPCGPGLIAQGDLNHDGVPDFVIPCESQNAFVVLLADGSGGFRAQRSYSLGAPSSIAIGDLNGDGNADLAIISAGSPTPAISLFFGNGKGDFPVSVTFQLPNATAHSLAIADFNGDGIPDLVFDLSGTTGSTLNVMLGDGHGGFQPRIFTPYSGGILFLMPGDFNGDGRTDLGLVAQSYNSPFITAVLGNGDGTFQTSVPKLMGSFFGTSLLTTGDFNHDGRSDVAGIVNFDGENSFLEIVLGQADGTFSYPPALYQVEAGASTVATADLNGDGALDLVVANEFAGTVTVLLGNGDGSFSKKRSYPAGILPYSVVIGGFVGEGRTAVAALGEYAGLPDLASAIVVVLEAGKDGRLAAPALDDLPGIGYLTLPADYNGDGKIDVISTNSKGVLFLAGNGDGTFQPPTLTFSAPGNITPIFSGDFNNDGTLDLFAYQSGNNQIGKVYLGNGDGTFHAAPSTGATIPVDAQPAFGDVNNDGILDLVTSVEAESQTIAVYLGNGDGTFRMGMPPPLGSGPIGVILGDFNNDGNLDIIASGEGPTDQILLGNGDGTFQPPVEISVIGQPIAADFNGDGNPDLVSIYLTGVNSSALAVAFGNGDGTFQTPLILNTTPYVSQLLVGDFNGDGYPDISVVTGDYVNRFYLSVGSGEFQLPDVTPYLLGPTGVRLFADFFHHGAQDALTSYGSAGGFLVLKNISLSTAR